jgi:DNA-binding transcriptional LysR family regulator
MDRLKAIEVFVEVARGRSFTAAAQRLGLAKGNVTKHVAWLEAQLGAQLLIRTTKSVSVTDAGIQLISSGQDLLDRFDNVGEAVREALKAPKGIIRIGTPPSFGAVHLVPIITKFTTLYQDIHFDIVLDGGNLNVTEEGLDLTLRIAPSLKDMSLAAKKLGSVPQLLVASPQYLASRKKPVHLEDLANHDCLLNSLKSPTHFWAFSLQGEPKTVRIHGRMRSNFGESLRHAALLGAGISMHPTYMVDEDIKAKRLAIVLPKYQPTGLDIYAVYPTRRNTPSRVRLFIDYLVQEFNLNKAWQSDEDRSGRNKHR